MKDLIRRGLDAYEGRHEKRDEELADLLTSGTQALEHRPTLKLFAVGLGFLNLLYWVCVVFFPRDVRSAFMTVADVDDKVATVVVLIVFGTGMWLTYSLFRFRFPDLENSPASSDVFSSFQHQENSYRRFRVWLISVVGGVLNLLALAIVEGLRL
jgi:hypothetical protein